MVQKIFKTLRRSNPIQSIELLLIRVLKIFWTTICHLVIEPLTIDWNKFNHNPSYHPNRSYGYRIYGNLTAGQGYSEEGQIISPCSVYLLGNIINCLKKGCWILWFNQFLAWFFKKSYFCTLILNSIGWFWSFFCKLM